MTSPSSSAGVHATRRRPASSSRTRAGPRRVQDALIAQPHQLARSVTRSVRASLYRLTINVPRHRSAPQAAAIEVVTPLHDPSVTHSSAAFAADRQLVDDAIHQLDVSISRGSSCSSDSLGLPHEPRSRTDPRHPGRDGQYAPCAAHSADAGPVLIAPSSRRRSREGRSHDGRRRASSAPCPRSSDRPGGGPPSP